MAAPAPDCGAAPTLENPMTDTSDRRERYATAIHDAMETDLSLVDQEPACQALIARAADAAMALADGEQNRQFLTTLGSLGIATHRLDQIRDAARLHRQQLLGTSELYAVIEADEAPQPEPDDPTQCSGEEGFCPEHGFHRHTLKQPGTADRAETERLRAERDSLGREADRLRTDWTAMRDRAERAEADRDWWRDQAHAVQARAERADRAAVLREAADAVARHTGNELDSSAKMLRRLAAEAQQQERSDVGTPEDRCAECGHFQGAHEEAEEPVSVGRCTVCADDDAWHNYEATEEERRLAGARRQPAAAPESEPPVHGESVAHLAGLHDDEPATGAEHADTETVHACPPDGSGLTPCCGRTPFELPLGDRISSEAPTTCTGPAAGARQDGARQ